MVVETIDFYQDEDAELPPPMTQRDVIILNKAGLEDEEAAPEETADAAQNGKVCSVPLSGNISERYPTVLTYECPNRGIDRGCWDTLHVADFLQQCGLPCSIRKGPGPHAGACNALHCTEAHAPLPHTGLLHILASPLPICIMPSGVIELR